MQDSVFFYERDETSKRGISLAVDKLNKISHNGGKKLFIEERAKWQRKFYPYF